MATPTTARDRRLGPEQAAALCGLLEEEEAHYRRLRRLAWRQARYLRRHDAARLEVNAAAWSRCLPGARAAREAREACQAALADRLGLPAAQRAARHLLDYAQPAEKVRVRRALERLAATAADLHRQNGLNVLLANFCLELAREESEIFRQCVLENPAGCYAGDGQPAPAPAGGVVWREA